MNKVILIMTLCFCSVSAMNLPDISTMSIQEKIGQLFMVATIADPDNAVTKDILFRRTLRNIPSIKTETEVKNLISDYHIGGVIFLGNSSAEKQYAMTKRLIKYNESNSKIPLLIGLDAEWGPSMRLADAIKFPFNIALGAMNDTELVEDIAHAAGISLKELGVDINFAPVADCNTNPENPIINRRSFGQDPTNVASCVIAYLKGIQKAGVAACAKHFPGHGDTATDSHTGLPVINRTLDQLIKTELVPFKAAVNNGIEVIMTAHILVQEMDHDKPATLSPTIIKKLLRKECNFDGLVVTDALDMEAITQKYSPEESAVLALLADCDLLVAPVDVPRAFNAIKEAVEQNKITMQELDEHVRRILAVKQKRVQHAIESQKTPFQMVNNEQLEALSKKAYKKAMTLVRNDRKIVPLKNLEHTNLVIIDVGSATESSFAQHIKKQVPHYTALQALSLTTENLAGNKESLQHADAIIIALDGLTYTKPTYGIATENLELIHKITQLNKNVVIVLFGNPYALELFEQLPAILVAYENHPYAQESAAQVILGTINPTGKLPVDCSPLFKIGTGTSY